MLPAVLGGVQTCLRQKLIVEGSIGYLDDSIDEVAVVPGKRGFTVYNFKPPESLQVRAVDSIANNALLLTPRLDVSRTAEQFFDAANTAETAQSDDVTVVNASVTLASTQGRWRATAGVNNLTDELYPVAAWRL